MYGNFSISKSNEHMHNVTYPVKDKEKDEGVADMFMYERLKNCT